MTTTFTEHRTNACKILACEHNKTFTEHEHKQTVQRSTVQRTSNTTFTSLARTERLNTTTSATTTSNTTANVEQVPKIRTQPEQHLYRGQNIEHNISVMRTEHPTQH